MNIRKIAALLVAFVFICAVPVNAKTLEFTIGSDTLYVSDGEIEAKTIDAKPYIENSRTMIPVRAVSENFGAEVSWDENEQKVIISKNETTIELVINSLTARINGEEKTLDCPPVIVDSRTMVPLRFISEALGKNVDYVQPSNQILISDEFPVIKIGNTTITADDYRAWFTLSGYVPDAESIEYVISQVTSAIFGSAILSNEAKNMGYNLTPAQCREITNSIINPQSDVYSHTLAAPIIKIYGEDLLASLYIEDIIKNEYPKNYVCAKHILITAVDVETGRPYDDEEIAAAQNAINTIKARLDAGEDFDTLMNEFCEDPGVKQNPDGYVFTYGEMVPEFEETAFKLNVGEISDVIETDYGYHIIKKEPLPVVNEAIQASVLNHELNKLFEKYDSKGEIVEYMTIDELAMILLGNTLVGVPQR